MRTVASFDEMRSLVGDEIGVSEWIDVSQEKTDLFAEATGDFQWIHVDVERAKAEMPGGKTIAHGYFTLSLVPQLVYTIYQIDGVAHGLNYGSNRVRFTAPVPSGSRVRARYKLINTEDVKNDGLRMTGEVTMELAGSERPALRRRSDERGLSREGLSAPRLVIARDSHFKRNTSIISRHKGCVSPPMEEEDR